MNEASSASPTCPGTSEVAAPHETAAARIGGGSSALPLVGKRRGVSSWMGARALAPSSGLVGSARLGGVSE